MNPLAITQLVVEAVSARLASKGGLDGESGMEVVQAVALAAAGVFAIIAIFTLFQSRAIELVNHLFDRMLAG